MADVFLSYNRQDQAKAKLIAEALESAGFEVWWDTVLRAGQTYDEVTEGQLRDAWAVVVLWSSRSVRSKWVRAEATLGDRKSALIPVMIEQCDRPIMFELIQTADLSHWEGDLTDPNWLDFVADVQEHVARKRGDAMAPSAPAAAANAKEPAKSPGDADTLEAAFWMSVQDSDDASDFEAYLKRYPQGHFAQLAKKRLTALLAPPPAPAPPPPAPAPTPAPITLAHRPAPTPSPIADAPKRPRQAKRSSQSNLLVVGAAVAALAVAAFLFMQNGDQTASTPAAAPALAVEAGAGPVDAGAPIAEVAPPEAPPAQAPPVAPAADTVFRDCPACPQMTRLPGGAFTMGSPANEPGGQPWERPQRSVQIQPFAIGTAEVTFAEWDACVAAGGCNRYSPGDRGWGRGAQPVLSVSWDDAQGYVRWLSQTTGKAYRLPSEAEWEYAARGGATTAYWWGERFEAARVLQGQTRDAASRDANPFGLLAVTGNVAEWVEDCYVNSFAAAPVDGTAVLNGNCGQRVVRGGSWRDSPGEMRIANRSRIGRGTRDSTVGFRVATSG